MFVVHASNIKCTLALLNFNPSCERSKRSRKPFLISEEKTLAATGYRRKTFFYLLKQTKSIDVRVSFLSFLLYSQISLSIIRKQLYPFDGEYSISKETFFLRPLRLSVIPFMLSTIDNLAANVYFCDQSRK